jgi:two-component system, OmpR family, sensor kinase
MNRLLGTLEQLLAIDETVLHRALDRACHMVAEALRADKVDAALYDSTTESLVAAGTSHTPMGRKQHTIGMNRLPLANGGREVDVFLTGVPYATGQADQDPGQLRGMTEGLGIGLYLASRIVAAHGGTLTADPTPTVGAKFQMKLPLADAPNEGDG